MNTRFFLFQIQLIYIKQIQIMITKTNHFFLVNLLLKRSSRLKKYTNHQHYYARNTFEIQRKVRVLNYTIGIKTLLSTLVFLGNHEGYFALNVIPSKDIQRLFPSQIRTLPFVSISILPNVAVTAILFVI